ncbi:MAG: sigma-54-dependent Fis family transcriptional regulator [Candidatus Omnitrophica bacterium]|nr:sigma-54-dependent Fis family transcriptional regulator [Candidatus Omnitrophota bacterium]
MKKKRRILIVDDEKPTVDSLDLLLGDSFELVVAKDGRDALSRLRSEPVDLVFLDITLPELDGFEVLRQIKALDPTVDVVMLTADDKARSAMRAMELGAFHYITKPFDKDEILLMTRRVLEKKSMAEEIVSLRDDVQQLDDSHPMVGRDPKLKEILKIISKVALTDSTVLITGESGTGKELVARAIHYQSSRKNRPFKAINCGAIPENLLESELFGHERGAFTGALERKIGKFEMAQGGTLFLDEISAMKETLQVKLLRVLQEQEIERVGSIKVLPIDVRIVAATNGNLRKMVETGQFREDLYYRVKVVHIHLPPLRDRQGDILILAEHYLRQFSKKFNKPASGFSEEAKSTLQDYNWPGNIRELKNVVERAVVLMEGPCIQKAHLPLDLAVPRGEFTEYREPFSFKEILDDYERKVILNILEYSEWNQSKAAEILGIHRNTLLAKLDALQIDVKQLKQSSDHKSLV